jgi:ATP-binding cassette subfamily B protein
MVNDGLGAERGKHANYSILLMYIGIMAGLMILSALARAWRERLMAVLGSTVSRDIRDRAYEHLHKLSLSFFSKRPTGSLVTRITSDSDRIWDFVAFTVIESVTSILMIAGVAAAMFMLNWKLACIVLLPVPVMLLTTLYFHRKLHIGHDRLFHMWGVMTAVVADALPGVRVIQAFSQERREVNRFRQKNDQYYDREVGMITVWTLFGPVMQFCTHIGILLVWIVGGYWTVENSNGMNIGKLITFTGYMWLFYGPIHMIAHMDRQLNRAATSVQRIFEILDTAPAIFSKSGANKTENVQGRIELRDVTFSYDGIRKVLQNVSLTIKPGEMIGLAGPSGGGKTTLVNLLCRFYDVLEGQILIDGKDVRDYDVESLRRQIGVVLQEPFLFHGTVAANIAYGHPQASLDEIITSAKAANAHDFIVGFPDGYDTMVGERGHTLSGGERQRISIARAILNNPRILILDEATSSVDTETEKLIQEALDRLVASRTTIAIAHRLSTLRKADRLVVLEKGKIIEQGTHEELTHKEGGLYAKLIRMQDEMRAIIAIG